EKIGGKIPEKPSDEAAGAKEEKEEEEEPEPEPNAFEKFTDILQAAPLYVLLGSAVMAFIFRHRPKISLRFLVAGFAFGFLVPITIALCPWSWFGYVGENVSPLKDPVKFLSEAAGDAIEALKLLAALLPAVLALIPGVLKGCMRVKTLLPAS